MQAFTRISEYKLSGPAGITEKSSFVRRTILFEKEIATTSIRPEWLFVFELDQRSPFVRESREHRRSLPILHLFQYPHDFQLILLLPLASGKVWHRDR